MVLAFGIYALRYKIYRPKPGPEFYSGLPIGPEHEPE